VVAIFNFTQEPLPATILAFPFAAPALQDLWSRQVFPSAQAGQPYTVTLLGAGTILLATPWALSALQAPGTGRVGRGGESLRDQRDRRIAVPALPGRSDSRA